MTINYQYVEGFINDNRHKYNVTVTRSARFMDQKVTPDVLSVIAEAILDYLVTNETDSFTVTDIRTSQKSNSIVMDTFNKPNIHEANHEYDKFFSQPIKMLAYSGVLEENTEQRPYTYTVTDMQILEYISLSERFSTSFLCTYLEAVLSESGIFNEFTRFFEEQNISAFDRLKTRYTKFIINNTPINTSVEVSRIFTKVLNPLSFKYKKLGTEKGRLSKQNIYMNDLLYNRQNWRDINKDKSITREAYQNTFQEVIENDVSYTRSIERAKRFVKSIHEISEIHRFVAYPATQAHHIFLKSEFPELANVYENIIAITPNQHFARAHPNNKTGVVSPEYQLICLLSKLDSIETDYRKQLNFYSKEKFVAVINTGLNLDLPETIDFEELKHKITIEYFSRAS
jgi:hypothetical protein